MNESQDKTIVLAVVMFLGVASLLGIASLTFLVWDKADAALVAVVATPTGTVIGSLASMLAGTKVAPPPDAPPPN